MELPLIKPGKRVLAAGWTGSGKSTWASWILKRSPLSWVILNPKHTAAYNELPDSAVVKGLDISKVEKALHKYRFIIINPNSRESNPDDLDDFVMRLHESFMNVGLCCDELYSLHKGGVAGAGLIGWLTRGRELKQSFLGLTQRPAWLSQFLFSESDFICGMSLLLEKDRKRMFEMTDRREFISKVPERYWLWYSTRNDELQYFAPVPLDK